MGEEVAKFTVIVGKEFGVIAVLLILSWAAGVSGLAWFLWQTSKNHARTTILLDKLYGNMDELKSTLSAHDRQGGSIIQSVNGMQEEMKKAQGCLTGVKTELAELKGKVS